MYRRAGHRTSIQPKPWPLIEGDQLSTLFQDIRFACRKLAKSPGFTIVAVLTLALGIGANIAIFGAIDTVLLKPRPYGDSERVLTLWQRDREAGTARGWVAPANFIDWRERSQSFEVLAAMEPFSLDYLATDGPVSIRSWIVTDGFFGVFGVEPLLGGSFRPEDHVQGAAPVAMLSYGVWLNRFGGNPEIVGRALTLDGRPTTVVGVMPPGFAYPPGRDIWSPRIFEGWERQARGGEFWQVVGKLKPDVSVSAAQAELDSIAAQLASEYAATNANVGIAGVPLDERLVENVRSGLMLFLGAAGLVLLIACVNVANLLLAQGAQRRRELAIRGVLGAGRGRLVRQLATESLLLAGIGGVLGLVLAAWGLNAFESLRPDTLPPGSSLALDSRIVGFAVLLALGTAVLFGLAPALGASRVALRERLHAATQSAPAARRFRGALVVAELALAMVLLIGAGLLIKSFVALLEVDRGYRTENVLALSVQAWDYYPDRAQRTLFVEDTLERIASLPGVLAAGVASSLPLADVIGTERATFTIEGRPPPAGGLPTADGAIVTESYFRILDIPLRSGRLLTTDDDADAPRVVLINESMARRYWRDGDPIGARMTFAFGAAPVPVEVVGVVADTRDALDEEPRPSFFVPYAQNPTGALYFLVRSAGDPTALVRSVQSEIWALNPAMPFGTVTTLDGLFDDSLADRRFALMLLVAFAATALTLAAVGTYGVLSYESGRRSHEIGVRMALGSDAVRVVGLVVGTGIKLGLIGIGIGTVIALATSRLLSRYLYEVQPFDSATFVGIALLLVAVTAIASWLPARRAARVDPMQALRQE
jgi:putative ABC transport system permease protein